MNPILLKPGSDRRSQVVVLGQPIADVDALDYRAHRDRLREIALAALDRLRAAYDVVICEGAGSPAEINLRAGDIANMGLARAAGLPVIVVGDIDRGGVFAALYGTLALLDAADQALVAGFVINKFRGAAELLAPGLDMLRGAHRPPGVRRAALARRPRGSTPRTRSRSPPAAPGRGRAAPGRRCGSPWCGCRGSPTSPTPTRSPPSPGVLVRFVTVAGRGSRTPTCSCCRAPGPPWPTWRGCA